MESADWRELKMRVENKRHTSAHQPLNTHSTTEASIPPLSARFKKYAKSPTKTRKFKGKQELLPLLLPFAENDPLFFPAN
jgi:hypothetical protein